MDERRRRLGQRPTGGAIRRRRPPPTLRAGQIDPCLSLLITSSFFRCREARKKERTNERKKERKKETAQTETPDPSGSSGDAVSFGGVDDDEDDVGGVPAHLAAVGSTRWSVGGQPVDGQSSPVPPSRRFAIARVLRQHQQQQQQQLLLRRSR